MGHGFAAVFNLNVAITIVLKSDTATVAFKSPACKIVRLLQEDFQKIGQTESAKTDNHASYA